MRFKSLSCLAPSALRLLVIDKAFYYKFLPFSGAGSWLTESFLSESPSAAFESEYGGAAGGIVYKRTLTFRSASASK